MILRERQSIFLKNIAKLITWAFDNGHELTGGALLITQDQQRLYFEGLTLVKFGYDTKIAHTKRKASTMYSQHLFGLAIELDLYIDGICRIDKESFKPLAEYWKSLHYANVSGYDLDHNFNHFQMI